MKFRPFFFALACMAVAMPVQASMHPDAAVDRWMHFLWHMQMTTQAAMAGNWALFWSMFLDQSICADQSWMTYIFTPAGFLLATALAMALLIVFIRRIVREMSRASWMHFRPNMFYYAR